MIQCKEGRGDDILLKEGREDDRMLSEGREGDGISKKREGRQTGHLGTNDIPQLVSAVKLTRCETSKGWPHDFTD